MSTKGRKRLRTMDGECVSRPTPMTIFDVGYVPPIPREQQEAAWAVLRGHDALDLAEMLGVAK